MPNPEIIIMRRGLITLGLLWILGIGGMIWYAETTWWASAETKAGPPSIETVASDRRDERRD